MRCTCGKIQKIRSMYICRCCDVFFPVDDTDFCPHKNTQKDPIRAQVYCKDCGLVLCDDYPFVSGIKVRYPPFYDHFDHAPHRRKNRKERR